MALPLSQTPLIGSPSMYPRIVSVYQRCRKSPRDANRPVNPVLMPTDANHCTGILASRNKNVMPAELLSLAKRSSFDCQLAGIACTPLADDAGSANRLRIHPRFHGTNRPEQIENALGTGILDSQKLARATRLRAAFFTAKSGYALPRGPCSVIDALPANAPSRPPTSGLMTLPST